jgi:hypothetical protein
MDAVKMLTLPIAVLIRPSVRMQPVRLHVCCLPRQLSLIDPLLSLRLPYLLRYARVESGMLSR